MDSVDLLDFFNGAHTHADTDLGPLSIHHKVGPTGVAPYKHSHIAADLANIPESQVTNLVTDLATINANIATLQNLGRKNSGAVNAVTSVTTTETVLTGLGNLSFTAVSGRRYLVVGSIAASSDTAADSALIRVRDGAGSAPTNTSTLLWEDILTFTIANRVYRSAIMFDISPSAGTHNYGIFGVRNAGTGTIGLGSAVTARWSTLMVIDIGT